MRVQTIVVRSSGDNFDFFNRLGLDNRRVRRLYLIHKVIETAQSWWKIVRPRVKTKHRTTRDSAVGPHGKFILKLKSLESHDDVSAFQLN